MTGLEAVNLIDGAVRKAFAAGAFAEDRLEVVAALSVALAEIRKLATPCAPCEEKKGEPSVAAPKA